MATRRSYSPLRPHAGRVHAQKRRRRVDSEEHKTQAAFFKWLSVAATRFPVLYFFYKIPNEGKRSKLEIHLALSEGLKAGVPDVHLPVTRKGFTGLWFEFKSATGQLSPAQVTWIEFLHDEGHLVHQPRTWTAAAQITIDYLELPIEVDDIPLPTPNHRKPDDKTSTTDSLSEKTLRRPRTDGRYSRQDHK